MGEAQKGRADGGGEARSEETPRREAPRDGTRPDRAEPGDAPAGDAPDDEQRVRAVVEELRRLKVEDLALDMAISLVTVGYQKLGLAAQTRELRDLGGARLSIELLRALLDVLEREGVAVKLGDLRGTLAAMQLNYARAAVEGAGAMPDAGAESAPDAGAASAFDAGAESAPGAPESPR